MTLPRLVLAFLLGALALATNATAGGWWSYVDLDRQTVAFGERVRLQSEAWFPSIAEARDAEENGRFYVYLLRGFDGSVVERAMMKPFRRNWWSLGDAEAVKVAPIRLDMADANLSSVRASFVLPELATGKYAVMLCDAGCRRPLGTAIPTTGFTVVADPATARLSRRVVRLQERIARRGRRVLAARTVARQAQEEAQAVGLQLVRLQTRLSALERRTRDEPQSGSSTPWRFGGWVVAAMMALALAGVLVGRRRSPDRMPLGWSAEDEALLASELSRPRRARTPSH
jgi:hypothetical protein